MAAPDTPAAPRAAHGGAAALGLLLLGHFGAVCLIKSALGTPEEIWWLSHVTLALTGCALLIRSETLLNAALIGILFPHGLWLIDWLLGFTTGRFPLGVTAYLTTADVAMWCATAHHFYLLPLLLLLVPARGTFRWNALAFTVIMYALVTVVSRFALPPASNVNSAFAVLPAVDWPLVRWTDRLPAPLFLLLINAWMISAFFLPVACGLAWFSRRQRRGAVSQ